MRPQSPPCILRTASVAAGRLAHGWTDNLRTEPRVWPDAMRPEELIGQILRPNVKVIH